ncbi:hypothetical protein [Spirosoma panaciterrae]|uniref:hypothetical protein n=1 Tax=Spirosoma panaciterrae TaxID=496058 RepID=UPI00036FB1DB|nr:hypothetical protein [Spirosoma panaciterrae]
MENDIPKWVKTLVQIVGAIAVISGILIGWANFKKDMAVIANQQSKDIKSIGVEQAKQATEQAKQATEQAKERTYQENYRLETEKAKRENIKLIIAQKEVENSIQKEALRSAQEVSRQREIESSNYKSELQSSVSKSREITRQDSIKLEIEKFQAQKEQSKINQQRMLDFLNNVNKLNDDITDADAIKIIQTISLDYNESPELFNKYYNIIGEVLLNRAYKTKSIAEIDKIYDMLSGNWLGVMSKDNFNLLLDIDRESYYTLKQGLGTLLIEGYLSNTKYNAFLNKIVINNQGQAFNYIRNISNLRNFEDLAFIALYYLKEKDLIKGRQFYDTHRGKEYFDNELSKYIRTNTILKENVSNLKRYSLLKESTLIESEKSLKLLSRNTEIYLYKLKKISLLINVVMESFPQDYKNSFLDFSNIYFDESAGKNLIRVDKEILNNINFANSYISLESIENIITKCDCAKLKEYQKQALYDRNYFKIFISN